MTICPIDCVRAACPQEDWLQKHTTFVLTFAGLLGAAGTVVLQYFLKSRCSRLKMCCIECHRTPIQLTADQVELNNDVI